MKLFTFLLGRSRRMFTAAAAVGALAGLVNTALLVVINTLLAGREWEGFLGAGATFVVLCAVLPLTLVASQYLVVRLAQNAVQEMRSNLARRVLAAPMRQLEALGPHRLMATLTTDIEMVAGAMQMMPAIFTQGTLALGCVVYLGWLAPNLLAGVLGVMGVGLGLYVLPNRWALKQLAEARQERDTLFDHLRGVTDGTKELKLHQRRRRAFFGLLVRTLGTLRGLNVSASTTFAVARGWGQMLLFAVIGYLVFSRQEMVGTERGEVVGYILVLLFLAAPLQALLNTIPTFGQAAIALAKVEHLGLSLDAEDSVDGFGSHTARGFKRLELRGITYTHRAEGHERQFSVGPLDFALEPGELVFLTGGNGSGKTTLAKLLLGLYSPDGGTIAVDGKEITEGAELERYRQSFSAVFADYFLFEQLLGLDHPELESKAEEYLRLLQLERKVEIKDGAFSTIALSQGQRKRLALLTAYLEDRPIYVFDEWAAEQDPVFREIFYRQMLPELRDRGKAVVVISHDDRYFAEADRVVKLEDGYVVYDGDIEHFPGVAAVLPEEEARAAREVALAASDAAKPEKVPGTTAKEAAARPPQRPLPWRQRVAGGLVAAVMAVAVGVALHQLRPIAPLGADAPPEVFSAARAMDHVREIAQSPRPMGSPEHDRVRAYVVDQLTSLGLEPQVQETEISRDTGTEYHLGRVRNVVARLAGQGGGEADAILLVAHYDSARTSPGAGDDGAAVAMLLETLRALRTEEPLGRDVIFLFTDGEEMGLLGARAFVEEHPWAFDAAVVLNFEARGTGGPLLMFQTGAGTRELVKLYGRVAPRPLSGSYFDDLYRLLPYDTDLRVFLRAGVPGLNFAFVDAAGHYHTALDRIDKLDPASVQHMGSTTLGIVRELGRGEGFRRVSGRGVWFNLLPGVLTTHSQGLILPLALLAVIAAALVLVQGLRHGRITFGATLGGAGVLLLVPVLAAVTVFLVRVALAAVLGGIAALRWGKVSFLVLGTLLLVLAVAMVLLRRFAARRGVPNLAAGGLVSWTFLTLVIALALPSTSYLFTLPLFCAAAAFAVFALAPPPKRPTVAAAAGRAGVLALLAVPILVLWTPVFQILRMALGFDSLVALAALFGFLAAILVPQVHLVTSAGRFLPLVVFVLALAAFGAGIAQGGFDADHPRPDSLFYAYEPQRKRALWATLDSEVDSWTARVLGEEGQASTLSGFFGAASVQVLSKPAPIADYEAARLEVTSDEEVDDARRLGLQVVPAPEVRLVRLRITSDTPIRSLKVGERRFEQPPSRLRGSEAFSWGVSYFAPPEGGFAVEVEVGLGQPVEVVVVEETLGLPQIPGFEIPPRPPELRPASDRPTDTVFVRGSYTF